ncbi:hypothetical protein LOD99_1916 [Oopsacas minuta]|uniref:Transposable element P transposase-like RNase H domain-containing protein n=1 Tax=Oopsacas minuta TaxID=111878 RepID=A0AAV7K5N1_9METZ|nr:hypothetical protein LOD99_1916 [Oopsacas minuta]
MLGTPGLDSEYFHILKNLTVDFSKGNRHVALNMDEIHVSSDISYQGGKVVGEIDPTTSTKKVDENETLRKHFCSSPSRKVLIQLTENMLVDNFSPHWRDNCKGCGTSGWTILRKILSVCTNCILANKVRNVNSEITSSKNDSRKLKKFRSI